MPFKIVGADDNGFFPTRVMNRLRMLFPEMRSSAPSPSSSPVFVDTSVTPPVIKAWNGQTWVQISAVPTSFSTWMAAVNNRGNAKARWLALGDSVTEGQGASARTNRWIDAALASLRNNYATAGNAGRGYIPSYYAHYMSWNTADYSNTTGTTSNLDYVGSLGLRTLQMNQGSSRTFSFTGTDIDISYTNNNGGQFTYAIDGGSAVTVTQTNQYRPDGLVSVSGLAAGNHTIVINSTSNTNYFNGIVVYNGDRNKGIHLLDSAHFGQFVNSIVGDSGILASTLQTMNLFQPDLITTMYGINEYNSGTSVANFQSQYSTLLTNLKSLNKVPSILVIIPYQDADGVQSNKVDNWVNYVAAIKSVCANLNLTYLDLSSKMPVADKSGSGYYDTDGVHPNNSGHSYIASQVVSALQT